MLSNGCRTGPVLQVVDLNIVHDDGPLWSTGSLSSL